MITFINGLTEVFRNILLSSIISAIITALIVISKLIFGKKMNAKSHARIWIILVFFLVIPVPRLLGMISFPEKDLIEIWVQINTTVQRLYIEPVKSVGEIPGDASENPSVTKPVNIVPSISDRFDAYKLNTSQIIWLTVSLIWLAGAKFFLAILFIGYRKTLYTLRKTCRTADPVWIEHLIQNALKVRCRHQVELVVSDSAESPYIIGIFHYRIVMPSGIFSRLEPEQIDEILKHELVHLRHFDPLLRLILCVVRCLHWFDPLLRIAIRLILKDHEYYCDEVTVTECGRTDSRSHYAETLLAAAKEFSGNKRVSGQLQTAQFIESGFKDRIIRVLQERRTSFLITVIAVLIVAITGCAILPGFIKTTPRNEPIITPTPAPVLTPTPEITLPANTPTPVTVSLVFQDFPEKSIFTELDFGDMRANTYEFYWSPYDHICMFKGYMRRESDNEFLIGIYFWNTGTNKVSQLVSDIPSRDTFTYLGTPSWSPDGKKVTIPLYIIGETVDYLSVYNIDNDTVEKMPFKCDVAYFSADSSKLSFTDENKHIKVYDIATKTIIGPVSDIDGSGLLFSDNRHLVNIARTVNPLGIEYTWRSEIKIVDLYDPANTEVIVPDIPGGSIEWLVQDKLLLLSVTADEVWPYIIIDVETHKITELGYPGISIFEGWGHNLKLVADYDQFQKKIAVPEDPLLKEMMIFTESTRPEYEYIDSISILPDDTILCLGCRYDVTDKTYLYLADSSGVLREKVILLPGSFASPVSSYDGKRVVLYDQYSEKTYMLDVERLYTYLSKIGR